MANLVVKLEVNRVDLVDEGCNSEAYIELYKRKEEKAMNFEEIMKQLKPEHRAEVEKSIKAAIKKATDETQAACQKQIDETDEELTVAKNKLAELETEVTKSKTVSDEEIMKSLAPEVQEVFKRLQSEKEANELIVAKLKAAEMETVAKAKAAELKAIPVEESKLIDLCKSMSDEVYEILKTANKLIVEGPVLKGTVGTGTTETSTDAWAKIEKRADEYIKADSSLTKEAAITKTIRNDKDLYKEYLKTVNGGAN